MSAGRIHVRLDPELRRAVTTYGVKNGLTISQAVRELLRQAVGQPPEPVSRGWREGFAQGHADYMRQALQGGAQARESHDWMAGAAAPPDGRRRR